MTAACFSTDFWLLATLVAAFALFVALRLGIMIERDRWTRRSLSHWAAERKPDASRNLVGRGW